MNNRPAAESRRFRTVPERSPEFAHLTLEALRTYRRALNTEEGRVSYWRRIIQARLDLVRLTEAGERATTDNLRGVITEVRVESGRAALQEIIPVDDMPPLPDLADLWAQEPSANDGESNHRLAVELSKAEAQLSAYRTALHKRLAAATGELIARYREEPTLCLSALPTVPVMRVVNG